ncbi:MAG TPA: AIR synthase-related protein, partial [Dehalococcoidia bacterium]|nr:AIR synthase-related protein [Dehalococcoidia bacterium]
YWQMEQAIQGMAAACQKLGLPVISGNVSLYNETEGQPIYPTPVVGMLGLLEDIGRRCGTAFQRSGDLVYLLGAELEEEPATLGGSEYLKEMHGLVAGRPAIDLEHEARVQTAVLEAHRQGLLSSCHDCSEGGLAVALAEACIAGGLGLDASGLEVKGRLDAALFGEAQGRFVVAVAPEARERLEDLARRTGVPLAYLGSVGGDRLRLGASIDLPVAELAAAYEGGLAAALGAP